MAREYWMKEELLRLKELHIDPVRSSPERLRQMVNYFRMPDSPLWKVTEGNGPLKVSKSLGSKVRDCGADGTLDWLMDETLSPTSKGFDLEWRSWLLSNTENFSQAVDVYLQELSLQIQTAEIHLGLRVTFEPRRRPRTRYGPTHRTFVESIFDRDQELSDRRDDFKAAIGERAIAKAKGLRETIGKGLVSRISV